MEARPVRGGPRHASSLRFVSCLHRRGGNSSALGWVPTDGDGGGVMGRKVGCLVLAFGVCMGPSQAHAVTYATGTPATSFPWFSTVNCPQSGPSQALSGGVEISPGFNNAYLRASVPHSAPGQGGAGSAWYGSASVLTSAEVTPHVVCARVPVRGRVNTKSISP